MPELPYEIWKDRIENELTNIKKLKVLEELRDEYQINYHTYTKLKKALKYDHSRNERDKFEFLKELPQSLNIELSAIMYEDMINKIPFFQDKSPHFISFIGIAYFICLLY